MLMLVTAGIYILALFSALAGIGIWAALSLTVLFCAAVIKDYVPLKYVLVWIFIFYLGIFNTSFRLKDTDDLLSIAPVNSEIYGKIISIPQNKNEDKVRFFFRVNKIVYDGISKDLSGEKTFVTLTTDEDLNIYDSYKLKGRLGTPFKAGNPSQFDYGNYLRNFDTYSVFYGKEFQKIDKEPAGIENLLRKINDYREKIIAIHARNLPSPNLEILGGIVFGDDAVSPPDNIKQSFVNSGLLHILAASGMNVAFIFSFFFYFLSMFKVNYKVNISFCILMVIVYSLMTGLGASVIRAALMLIFVLVGKLIDRDTHSIALLSFVAFLMLLYNPLYINDVGFQLSFIVTFGLLLMTPYLIKSQNRIINWITGTLCIPLIAQLWVMPIQIFYFNNISLYSVFANIMSVPVLSVISFGGFVSSLAAPVTPDFVCKCFDFILNPLITFLVNISDFWGNLPNATLQTTHPNISQIILYYFILLNITAFFTDINQKWKKILRYTLPAAILILLLTFIPIKNQNLEVTAFDVGNADAFLIKTPDNKYLMIDTAKSGYNGGKSQAEFLILKYLKDRGIKNIDTIIVTHFDNDHCGGTVDLMNGVRVERLYVNSLTHNSNSAKSIYETAEKRNVKLILAGNNQEVWNRNGLKMTNFISPDSFEYGDNEASILTLLEYQNFKMLFTGDAGISAFNKLKAVLPGNVTVLKAGHHGALGSINKDMANYLNPKITLISVGENKFGHPSVYTLNILKNTKILRTDIHNSIKFVVNKNGGKWGKAGKVYNYDIKKKKYVKLLDLPL